MKDDLKVTERGWAGHFCESHYCLFKRNTLIEYKEEKIVVSTIGGYLEPISLEVKKIGAKHYYETMVFKAKWEKPYWEADTLKPICIKAESQIEIWTRESSQLANQMHQQIINKVSSTLINDLLKTTN